MRKYTKFVRVADIFKNIVFIFFKVLGGTIYWDSSENK